MLTALALKLEFNTILLMLALAATIIFWRDYYRSLSASESLPSLNRRMRKNRTSRSHAPTDRCPHCGKIVIPTAPLDNDDATGIDRTVIKKCPHCSMSLDWENWENFA